MRPTLTALLLIALGVDAQAASPNLAAIRPVGGQRGTELEISLTGARLGDAKELLFHHAGITVNTLQAVNDTQVKATIKIAPDCRLGLHDLRLRTATGISELRSFSVGALKEVAEVEPNSDFARPQTITMDTTVAGVADNEDVDYFAVEAKKGERITAEVEGIRLGITLFDPYVAILDAKRFELASSDDAALIWQDGFASLVAPADGTYIIQVRESAYAGNGSCLYRLHIGRFPRPTATVPLGGKLGETVALRWIGDVLGEKKIDVKLPDKADRDFGINAQDDRGIAPYPSAFRLSPFGNGIEAEPNDDPTTATPFDVPIGLNGVIDKAGDVDYFVFAAKKGQVLDIRVFARALRSPLDAVLHVAKKGGAYLAGSDDSAGPDSYLRFTAPEDGDYLVFLHDHLRKVGPDYAYRIEVGPVEPKLTLSVPNESMTRGTGAIGVSVPRGNRQAILVNAGRADFGGDLQIAAEGLPAGLTFEADAMATSIATMPVLFTAKADAPVSGSLASLVGRHADPKVKVPCEFSHVVELVLEQNNVLFWTRTVDRLAVAVTEECPYTIEVVEPKVPLVRGGSMNLKVVAERKEGFKAAIAVSLPWNPPGVGSSGGVAIAEGQNEALIPMNADGGAELRDWRIVVNGYSGVASGPIMVSSQLAKLTIAAPFVNLGFQPVSVEQGKEVDLPIKVARAADFPGEATVTLCGLPNKATAEPKTITKDTNDLIFHLKTDAATPAGNHPNLFCQVVVTMNGEPIVHNLGTGQLRVDVPLPPRPNAPAPVAAAKPAPASPSVAPPKIETRIEKLRREHKERAGAAAADQKVSPK